MKRLLLALAFLSSSAFAAPCLSPAISVLGGNQNLHRTTSLDVDFGNNGGAYHGESQQATNLASVNVEADMPIGCVGLTVPHSPKLVALISIGAERAWGHMESVGGNSQPHIMSTALYAGPKICLYLPSGTNFCGAAYPTVIDFKIGDKTGSNLGALTGVASVEQIFLHNWEVRLAAAYRDLPNHNEYLASDIKEANYSIGIAYLLANQ